MKTVFGAFFLERRRPAAVEKEEPRDTSPTPSSEGHFVRAAFYWCGILILFAYLQLEVNAVLKFYLPLRLPMLTVLWCVMAGYFLLRYFASEKPKMMLAASIFLMLGVAKVISVDLHSWHLDSTLVYDMAYVPLYVLMRFLDFGVVLLTVFIAWHLLRTRTEENRTAAVYGYGGLLVLFIYLTLELNSFLYWKLRPFQAGGVSVLWALFAVAFVGGGIWRNVRGLRYAGLVLFAIIVGKVFLVDLANMPALYRVIAFLVVGIALLIGSFAYLRAAPRFKGEDTS